MIIQPKGRKTLRMSHPNLFTILIAILVAGFGYVFMGNNFGVFDGNTSSVTLRTLYIAANCLLMSDVIETAYIARGTSRDLRNPHVWIYGFYMGYFWFIFMVLFQWDGVENVGKVIAIWAPGAAFFGAAMAYISKGDQRDVPDRFDLEKPMTEPALGGLYYIWPIVVTAAIIGLTLFAPSAGWTENRFLFQMILLGSLMPLYSYKTGSFWRNFAPRLIGITLLLMGLLVLP